MAKAEIQFGELGGGGGNLEIVQHGVIGAYGTLTVNDVDYDGLFIISCNYSDNQERLNAFEIKNGSVTRIDTSSWSTGTPSISGNTLSYNPSSSANVPYQLYKYT